MIIISYQNEKYEKPTTSASSGLHEIIFINVIFSDDTRYNVYIFVGRQYNIFYLLIYFILDKNLKSLSVLKLQNYCR